MAIDAPADPVTSPARTSPPPRDRRRYSPGRVAAYAALGVLIVATLFPFFWIIRTGLSTNSSLFSGDLSLLPSETTLVNFKRVLGLASPEEVAAAGGSGVRFDFWLYLRNSLVVSVLITVGQVSFCAMAAYAFARLRFPGRDALFYFFLSALMIPPVFVLIPNFIFLNSLGLLDTYAAVVAPYVFMTPFTVFFLRQFFLGINKQIEEAAKLDGAGHVQIFTLIAIPMMAAPLATSAILTFISAWNEYMWPLVVGQDEGVRVLTVALSLFRAGSPQAAPDWTGLMAATFLSAVPIIVLFLALGRRVVDSIQFSGVK
jgi:multiple sugar transport system permease protein